MHELAKNIEWLGHAGFLIHGSKKICMDPFQLKNRTEKADIVLVSHEHFDHCSPKDIAMVSTEKTVIVASDQAAKQIGEHAKALKPGQTIEIEKIKIFAVSAYNINKFREPGIVFHPKADQKNGFVFEMDNKRFYHAGDTDFIPEMKQLQNIDVAFLPVSGTYVMTPEEAAQAANTIKPKLAIPMHFGSIVGTQKDAQRFKSLSKVPVEILQQK